jgi:myosin-crossreactive antigen
MSLGMPCQPHFPDIPPNTFTAWGYGLFIDAEG